MFGEIIEVVKAIEFFGVNIPAVIVTSAFVGLVKSATAEAGIKMPSWVWLILVMAAGFIVALFETSSMATWGAAGIKYGTAASYAYKVWSKILDTLNSKDGGT